MDFSHDHPMRLPQADRLVLKALHSDALQVMSLLEWIGVIKQVAAQGGIRNTTGYAQVALQKAKDFGGDRGAAGRYAAQMRWARAKGGVSDGAVATSNPAGAGEAMNMEKIGEAHTSAISAVGADTPNGKKLVEAQSALKESRKADVRGDTFTAWEKASQAAFSVSQVASERGAPREVRRLSSMLEQLVLDLTDAFYAEQEAA